MVGIGVWDMREVEIREESGFAAVGVAEEEDGYCWGVVHGQGARSTMGLAYYRFRAFVIYLPYGTLLYLTFPIFVTLPRSCRYVDSCTKPFWVGSNGTSATFYSTLNYVI